MHWKNPFEVPRAEKIDRLTLNGSGNPLILSTYEKVLLIRPIDPVTGLPKKLLSIRSNDQKILEQYQHHGDSIFALVRSGGKEHSDHYEQVIYTLTGDSLAEAYRRQIALPEHETRKAGHPIFFAISDNGKHTLVCRQLAFDKLGKATVFVETTSFPDNKTAHFELPTPYDPDDLDLLGASVDDDGIIYFAAKAGVKLNSPFMRKFLVYSFNKHVKELHEFDLSSDKVFLQDMIVETPAHGLLALALYATDPFAHSESNGFAFLHVDSLGRKTREKRLSTFTPEMVRSFNGEDAAENSVVRNLFLDNIYTSEGLPVAIMDQRYRDQVCTTDPRTGIMTCTDQFHFDDIRIENLVDPAKSTTIKRKQVDFEHSGPFVSQQVHAIAGKIIIFYNDHFKNDNSTDRIMNNPARSAMRYVSVSPDGTVNTALLTEERQDDFIFVPTIPGYHTNKEIAVLGSDGRNYRIGMIQLERLK